MAKFITRKIIKLSGNQLMIAFTPDEKTAFKLQKGQTIQVEINTKIKEEE